MSVPKRASTPRRENAPELLASVAAPASRQPLPDQARAPHTNYPPVHHRLAGGDQPDAVAAEIREAACAGLLPR